MNTDTIESVVYDRSLSDHQCREKLEELLRGEHRGDYPDFSTARRGDIFSYRGIDFIFLDFAQGGALCMTKQPIGKVTFSKGGSPSWHRSDIRRLLTNAYCSKFCGDDILLYRMDLTGYGCTGFGFADAMIGLPSFAMCNKYSSIINRHTPGTLTCTPYGDGIMYVTDRGLAIQKNPREAAYASPVMIFEVR